MKIDKDDVWRVIRIFFPEQRKWVARSLFFAGLSIVAAPVWEPYVTALLARFVDVNVPAHSPIIGGVLLALGLVGVVANETLDRWSSQAEVSQEVNADKDTLLAFFSELHLPSIDMFIDYGKSSFFYTPVLHYYSGVEAMVGSSAFHLYDSQLKGAVERFYNSFSDALSFGEYFIETNNDRLQKFSVGHGTDVDSRAEKACDEFLAAVYETELSLRALCKLKAEKYPEIELNFTNQKALEDYNKYYQNERLWLRELELSVLTAIVEMEEVREVPTLESLAAAIGMAKIDIRVALDKLISEKFALHLYPGTPWQKFTILELGRAYYVQHRDSVCSADVE